MPRPVAPLVALLATLVPAPAQQAGSVLTSSDIESGHLFRRPVQVDGRDWLGLYLGDGGGRLAAASPRWIGEEDFGDSIFTLAVDPPSPVMLVADVPGVAPGPAVTVARGLSLTRSSPRADLQLEAGRYSFEMSAVDPMLCDARVELSDGETVQELYFPDYDFLSCDEPHFTVEWAGDLDGDGRLDAIVTFSQKYSYYPRRLYLSSAAADGALVGLVAAFDASAA